MQTVTKGSQVFLQGGSTISDAFVTARWGFRPEWTAELFVQGERFLVPTYMPGSQSNGSGRLQITWTPHRSLVMQP